MNETALQIFNNPEFGEIRFIEIDGKLYAVGVDVARALGYALPSKAVIDHCKGISKLEIPSDRGIQETNIIPEGEGSIVDSAMLTCFGGPQTVYIPSYPPQWYADWLVSLQMPVVDFSAAPLSGDFPLSVTFADATTKSPVSWLWSFGDGTYGSTQNPVHVYNAAGVYSVELYASNAVGSTSLGKTDYITVTTPVSHIKPVNAKAGQRKFLGGTPNPFSASVNIYFLAQAADRRVTLSVTDVSGKIIRRLTDSVPGRGYYSIMWDGRNEQGTLVPSGVYMTRLTAGGRTTVEKLLLMR